MDKPVCVFWMSMDKPHVIALKEAVRIAGGTHTALAAKLRAFGLKKVSQQHVSYWLKSGILLDAKYWPAIERATAGQVTREQLRPDVFRQDNAVRAVRHG